MTVFTTIADALVAVGAKPFATTIQALRDNLLAGLECDPTAPTNQAAWHPYNRITAGSTNVGRIYNFGTDGVLASVVTPDYQDGFEYRIRVVGLSHNAGSAAQLQIENFRETDAAYNPSHSSGLNLISSSGVLTASVELLTVRQSLRVHTFRIVGGVYASNSAVAATVDDRADLFTTGQKILKSRISFTTGSIDAGAIFLDRRAVYS